MLKLEYGCITSRSGDLFRYYMNMFPIKMEKNHIHISAMCTIYSGYVSLQHLKYSCFSYGAAVSSVWNCLFMQYLHWKLKVKIQVLNETH